MFLTEKEYQVDYVLSTPPLYAKKYPDVWREAFTDYLSRRGKDINKIKKVDNIEWNEVVRIFNTLLGVKNRERPDGFKKKKNTDLIAEKLCNTLKRVCESFKGIE